METSMSNVGMEQWEGAYSSEYAVKWPVPIYTTVTNTVREVFMFDFPTNMMNRNSIKYVSRLLATSAWESDFVTSELKAKGGMAIGGPTIEMWCKSWNKKYPNEKIMVSTEEVGYVTKTPER